MRTPPPYTLGLSNRSSARRGAHTTPHPLCCLSVSCLSRCLRGRSRAPLPNLWPCAGRGRRSQSRARLAPHTRSRQTAAPAPAHPPARAPEPPGQRRGAGRGTSPAQPLALCAERKPRGKPQQPALQDEEAPGSSTPQGRHEGRLGSI